MADPNPTAPRDPDDGGVHENCGRVRILHRATGTMLQHVVACDGCGHVGYADKCAALAPFSRWVFADPVTEPTAQTAAKLDTDVRAFLSEQQSNPSTMEPKMTTRAPTTRSSRRPANRQSGMTPTTYVSRVSGRLKRGDFTVDLAPKTLIVGSNGRGKTSVCNAITLALCEFAHDVGGKDTVTDSTAIFRHLSTGGDPVESHVTLSDGRTFSYHKEDSKREDGAHLPGSALATVFPIAGLRDGLTGSPQTVRKWVLGAASRWMTQDALKHAVANLGYADAVSVPDGDLDIGEWIEAEQTAAEKQRREAQDEARAVLRSVDALRTSAGLPVSDHAVEEARVAAEGAVMVTAGAQTAHEHDTWTAEVARWQGELATWVEQLPLTIAAEGEARNAVIAWDQEAGKFPSPQPMDPAARASLEGFYAFVTAHKAKWTNEGGHGPCGLCGTGVDAAAYAGRLDAMIAQAHAVLHPVDPAAEAKQHKAGWVALLKQRETARVEAQRAHDTAVVKLAEAEARAARPIALQATADQEAARERYADLIRRQAMHQQLSSAAKNAEAHNSKIAALDRKVTALKALAESMIAVSVGMLEQAVSAWLPDGESFKVEIGATHARVGLVIGDVFRSGVSGAEEARMYAALCCALATGDLVVVMPAERQWSPDTLRAVMRALEKAPGQVILVSTVHPSGKGSKAWKVLDLDMESALDGPDDGAEGEPPTDANLGNTSDTTDTGDNVIPLPGMTAVPAHPPAAPPVSQPAPVASAPVSLPVNVAVELAHVAAATAIHTGTVSAPVTPPVAAPPSPRAHPSWIPTVPADREVPAHEVMPGTESVRDIWQGSDLTVWSLLTDGRIVARTSLNKRFMWSARGEA